MHLWPAWEQAGLLPGIGGYLKEKKGDIKIVAVEPSASPVLSGGRQDLTNCRVLVRDLSPEVLNTEVYDRIMCVENEEAFIAARKTGQG